MEIAATARADALEQPLPAELTGRAHGWFGRYRAYPVFSAAWVRGRLRSWGLVLLLLNGALAACVYAGAPPGRFPLAGLFSLALQLALPLLVGPWMCLRVRRLGLAPVREWWALVAAIGAVIAAMALFYAFAAEPLKHAVAQAIGDLDASGKRKTVRVSLGVNISSPDGPDDPMVEGEAALSTAITFLLVAFALAGGGALFGYRKEISGLAQLARERELRVADAARREAELRLSVLAAQVEPHFLFNTLAGVRSAIHSDPARASEMIDRLVEYLRASIPRLRGDASANASANATVSAQLDAVRAYLGLMTARMPRLRYRIDVPPDLLAAHCPPLMLISLAENAVKHGIEPKIGAAEIAVDVRRGDDGRLLLTVEDDGVGFAQPGAAQSGGGLGLANIRERLKALYRDAATLTLRARAGGGVAACIALPLELLRNG